MTTLQHFEYSGQAVRTVQGEDGEPWFVAGDVAKILGYRDAYNMVRRLDMDDKGTHSASTPGGTQTIATISEAGLYVAILGSQVPGAKAFKRWVTHEVVPAIRKTGSYSMAPAPTGPELLALAVVEAQQMIAAKEERIAEMTPKVDYVDTFVADDDLLSFRTVAADLNVGEQALREQLIDAKWIYRQTTTRWSNSQQRKVPVNRYSAHADKRAYFQPVMHHDAPRFRGEVMHSLKVTPAGAAALARRFRRSDEVVMAGECR